VASGRFRLLLVPWSGERRKKDRRGGRRRAGRRLRSEKRAENDDGGGEARAKEEEGRRERERAKSWGKESARSFAFGFWRGWAACGGVWSGGPTKPPEASIRFFFSSSSFFWRRLLEGSFTRTTPLVMSPNETMGQGQIG
jgi:hypothetical protein